MPSLTVNAPTVLWRSNIGTSAYRPGLALAAGRVAFVAGNSLFLVDARTGTLVASVRDDTALAAREPPVAGPDATFYFAGARVFAVDPQGGIVWQKPIYPGAWGDSAGTSALRLDPGGVLYFAADDGMLRALRAVDGQELWAREVGLTKGAPRWLGSGVGDTIFVEGVPHDTATGAPGGQPFVDGLPVVVGAALASRLLLAGRLMDGGWGGAVALDRCGVPLWSPQVPGRWGFGLVGPGENVLVRGRTPDGTSATYVYSGAGEPVTGPAEVRGLPNVFGRDGTLYTVDCEGETPGSMRLRAYGTDLALRWELPLGRGCAWGGAVLDDRGVLFVARDRSFPDGVEVIAIQTRSPGTLDSSWPTLRHDARGTGWLGQNEQSP